MKAHNKRFTPDRTKYIVYSNPKGAAKLLFNKGYEPPKKISELLGAVKELSRLQGEKFQKELLSIHPEKEMLSIYLKESEQKKKTPIKNHGKQLAQNEKENHAGGKEFIDNIEEDENYNSSFSSPCPCGGACGGKGQESSFCGCGGAMSSFSPEKKVEDLNDKDLDAYYRKKVKELSQTPGDDLVMGQMKKAWAELQKRNTSVLESSKKENGGSAIGAYLHRMMTVENGVTLGVVLVLGVLIGRALKAA